jgi:hypothetical protein
MSAAILFRMNTAYASRPADRRLGILLTVLVHAALILGWQAVGRLPPRPADGERRRIQWIRLPAPRAAVPVPTPMPAPAREPAPMRARARSLPPAALPSSALPATPPPPPSSPATASAPPSAPATAASPASAPAQAAAPAPGAGQILEQARRDIGKIDKALRKENRPTITAPLDSPQIRLRKGLELANELAPNRLWEAPKVEELVNNTGDGARRTRVITGNGSYCVTERASNTSVDMIEKHGKLRITSCPEHEEPAKDQAWRTARD